MTVPMEPTSLRTEEVRKANVHETPTQTPQFCFLLAAAGAAVINLIISV